MREIKFRAWHRKEKHFLTQIELTDPLHVPVIPFATSFSLDNSHVDFQQYTGVKDKNGKEIYEGDLLIYHYLNNGKSYHTKPFVVKWRQTKNKCGFNIGAVTSLPKEIIGNIYENPNLLEV